VIFEPFNEVRRSELTGLRVLADSEGFTMEKHCRDFLGRYVSMMHSFIVSDNPLCPRFRLTKNLLMLEVKVPILPKRRMLDLI